MQAITTKVIPSTNHKPTRIKAECARGSIIVSVGDLSIDDAHVYAVASLVNKFANEDFKQYGSPRASNPWLEPTISGTIKNGDMVHVFVK